ncbi:hypothetical protein ACHWQZ_G012159 [Mnemiopsis leidyi]
MRGDIDGETQTKKLLKQKTMFYGNHTIVFKPAYRRALPSQKDKELVFTKVISSSELFDSDAETDGSEELKPSSSTSPTLCACCARPSDTFPQFTLVPLPEHYFPVLPAVFPTQMFPYTHQTTWTGYQPVQNQLPPPYWNIN